MANKIYKFRCIGDAIAFLNGAITGGKAQDTQTPMLGGKGLALVGKTLIFTSPSAQTVTFVRSDGSGGSAHSPGTNPDPFALLFKDIKAQIEAALATVLVTQDSEGRLVITEVTPSSGVAVTGAGTANVLLGFDSASGATGKIYSPAAVSNAPPCWTWAYSGNDNMHNVYVWE